tara:strand:- start:743 stop:961 length:219 start_codon:yes stop_codon:yes gene_type:complete
MTNNTELTLDQLQQINGGLLSAGEIFDFWVDAILGDTIDDIKSSADKVKKMDKENSVHQPPGTEGPRPGVWY